MANQVLKQAARQSVYIMIMGEGGGLRHPVLEYSASGADETLSVREGRGCRRNSRVERERGEHRPVFSKRADADDGDRARGAPRVERRPGSGRESGGVNARTRMNHYESAAEGGRRSVSGHQAGTCASRMCISINL